MPRRARVYFLAVGVSALMRAERRWSRSGSVFAGTSLDTALYAASATFVSPAASAAWPSWYCAFGSFGVSFASFW